VAPTSNGWWMAAEPARGATADPLKLRAVDGEDIAVMSAILQDALVAVSEIAYLPDEHRFVMIANRFRGEVATINLERVRCGVRFDNVTAVWRQGFSPRDRDRILVLLAIRAEDGVLRLDFAGGPAIRLEVAGILCHLEDLGEPWPTPRQPRHRIESGV